MLGSKNQANLIVSGGNSSHNSKTETEQTRFGRAWTTLRVSDSMRRINYTSKRSIHSTESYSKNSIDFRSSNAQ